MNKKLLTIGSIIAAVILVLIGTSNLVVGYQPPGYLSPILKEDEIQKTCGLGDVVYSFPSPGTSPQGLAWDGNYLWNADHHEDKIYKIDPSDGSVVDSFSSPGYSPEGLTWDGNYLWHTDYHKDKIYKIDPSNGNVVSSISAPGWEATGLTWDGNYLWHADHHEDKIYKIDPSDGSVVDSFSSPCLYAHGLAWDGNYLWHADYLWGKIYKIDPSDGSVVSSFNSPDHCPTGLTWDGNYLWCADTDDTIYKIDVKGLNDSPPNACYTWNDADGDGLGTVINFDASCSTDDNGIVSYEWDWTSDGTYDETGKIVSHDYGDTNNHKCTLRVTDTIDQTNTNTQTVHAIDDSGDILLEEGFEDGVMPPPGWSVDNGNTENPWQITNKPGLVHSGEYAAFQMFDDGHSIDNWLWSPNIDLAGCPKIILKFWVKSTTLYDGATVELHIKGSGFDNIIWDMRRDENWDYAEYREKTFDLNSYSGKTIKVGWRYVQGNPPPAGDHFVLDDIIVIDPENGGNSQQQSQQQQQLEVYNYQEIDIDRSTVSIQESSEEQLGEVLNK